MSQPLLQIENISKIYKTYSLGDSTLFSTLHQISIPPWLRSRVT